MYWKIIASLFAIVLLVGGCAPMSPNINVAPQQAKESQLPAAGWWTASFQINWQEVEPAWYIDAILAHRVISPALELQKKDILQWRFHRRAVKDEAGHQFSFLFFAEVERMLLGNTQIGGGNLAERRLSRSSASSERSLRLRTADHLNGILKTYKTRKGLL